MSSVMVVDGSLATSLAWIAEYIDNLNDDTDGHLSQLVKELSSDEEVPQEVYFTLAEASHSLLKAPDAEFEGVFNLLLYILSQSSDFSRCVPVILASFDTKTTETKQLLILAVLGNLFNVIDPQNRLRFDVLSKIIDFSTANGTLRQMIAQLSQLPAWFQMWGCDAKTISDFYTKIIDLTAEHVGHRQAFALLVDGAKAANNDVLAKRLVQTALENTFTYDFDTLIKIPAVAALNDSTFKAVSEGDCEALLSNTDEQVLNKVRAVKLAKLAASEKVIGYDTLIKETGVESDFQVEALIIDAIKAGLFEGRMDQFERQFFVESASIIGDVTTAHWETINERLESWKQALQAHSQAVLGVKNPAERVSVPI